MAKGRSGSPGWKPQQHGAWAMLALPVFAGVVLRLRSGPAPAHLWWLAACWVAGYLAFNAASTWLKSPQQRRGAVLPALVTYTALAGVLGLVTVALAGFAILGWLVPFVPLVAGALLLAASRRERSLAGGALTVAAASLMTLVTRFDAPGDLLAHLDQPAGQTAVAVTGLVFCYLFGTVLYVKTMIRRRGRPGWVIASAAWHGAATAASWALVAAAAVGAGWPAFFLATLARALAMPGIARRWTVRPVAVGLVEIAFSVAFALLVVTATG